MNSGDPIDKFNEAWTKYRRPLGLAIWIVGMGIMGYIALNARPVADSLVAQGFDQKDLVICSHILENATACWDSCRVPLVQCAPPSPWIRIPGCNESSAPYYPVTGVG